jgi:hypothetical protein
MSQTAPDSGGISGSPRGSLKRQSDYCTETGELSTSVQKVLNWVFGS